MSVELGPHFVIALTDSGLTRLVPNPTESGRAQFDRTIPRTGRIVKIKNLGGGSIALLKSEEEDGSDISASTVAEATTDTALYTILYPNEQQSIFGGVSSNFGDFVRPEHLFAVSEVDGSLLAVYFEA